MGSFYMASNINKTYYAEIESVNGVTYKYELPKVHKQGYVLSLKTLNNTFRGTITSNFSKTDSLFVKVISRGVLYHDLHLKSKDGIVNLAVNRNSFPEGIVAFTVYNSKKQPICERLLFNYREEDARVQIDLKTNLERYNQREETIIDIKTQTPHEDSIAPKVNASLLVLNKKQLETMHTNNHSILSYFLLHSELKGNIEKPKRYFDKDNKYRKTDMDALMLTQGWRNYIYKPSVDELYFREQPEKNLIISGSIGQYFNRKVNPKKPLTLSLMTFGKDADKQIIVTPVDSTGRFKFNIEDNYVKDLEFLVQTTNHKNKKRDYTINIDKPTIAPRVSYKREEKLQLADSFKVFVEENIKRRAIEKYFETPDDGTIALDAVNLQGYKATPERKKMNEIHGIPDVFIDNDELRSKIDWTNNLLTLLKKRGPRAVGSDFSFIIMDGRPLEYQYYDLLGDLPAEEIESVEIILNPKNPNRYLLDVFGSSFPAEYKEASLISFICIYSFANKGIFGIPHKRTKGIYKKKLPSFAIEREFYAPKYEDLTSSDWNIPDLRSVVHWEPNVKLDSKGEAKVSFYNGDNTGDMLVIVESISNDAKLGYYETTYTVDERLEN